MRGHDEEDYLTAIQIHQSVALTLNTFDTQDKK